MTGLMNFWAKVTFAMCYPKSILHFIVNNLLGANDITTHRKMSEYSSVLQLQRPTVNERQTICMHCIAFEKWKINGLWRKFISYTLAEATIF